MYEKDLHTKDLVSHISDIKTLIIKLFIVFCLCFAVAYNFHESIINVIQNKFLQSHKLHYFTIEAPFFLSLKISFLGSIILFLPFFFVFIGSYASCLFKKKFLFSCYVISSLSLFYCGIFVGFYYIVPFVVKFMFSMANGVEFTLNASSFFNTIFMLCCVFGFVFQVPILIFGLLQSGIVSIEKIKKFRKIYIILSFVVGAIVTPPDVVSQIIVALLFIILFEGTILFFSIFHKKNAKV